MRLSRLAIGIAGLMVLAACHHPKPQTQPSRTTAPVVPATPPPAPAPATPPEVARQVDEYERLRDTPADQIDRMGLLTDIHFDYDSAELREADRQTLTRNAEVLKRFDFLRVTVEGHCDERGSVEFNLALGERRAKAASDYLTSLGVVADRLRGVSYGKEIPLCSESTEDCWARNRRGHFAITGKVPR